MYASLADGISGHFICPDSEKPNCNLERNKRLLVDENGVIVQLEDASNVDHEDIIWLPGFVDTHVHYPQHRVRGRSSGQLLPWLEETVFPEEARFGELAYATEVAEEFSEALLRRGTTCAQIFGSSDELATYALFSTLRKVGMRAQVGLTLMDQNAPLPLCVGPAEAEMAIRRLVKKWHGADRDRLQFIITPRFALSCSEELLALAGQLSEELNLGVQTHISENLEEVAAVASAFPQMKDYFAVYEHFGLAHEKSIFAHCIHLSEDEWDRMTALDCAVSHCPDSNFFLGSGLFPWRKAKKRNLRIGLGSDVGAGRTYCMRRIASSAYDTALALGHRQAPKSLLWHATRGGALAVQRKDIGCLDGGFECDLIGVRVDNLAQMSEEALFDRLLFQTDGFDVVAVYVRGQLIFQN